MFDVCRHIDSDRHVCMVTIIDNSLTSCRDLTYPIITDAGVERA